MKVTASNLVGDPTRMAPRRAAPATELFAVGAVLLLVLTILGPAVLARREAARQRHKESQIRDLGNALSTFHDTHGRFPASPRRVHEPPPRKAAEPMSPL